ncbi:MAG TPA: MBL fold metallo-hydrolase [Candidatus Scybalocola faecigallinarum]|uniref:MBL fold metallo-hydrolase n=1 Tax=Candidatus Scybalocola faecigallinarum TaxID=2840941 RepID=A0A9D1F217_9FIRM|nr:MBL fold metallo-hydrolase [Candidatus Scybalocola faecigallinarum]
MSEMKDYYTIKKMNGYYRIGCAEKSFGYLITGKDKAALIDTGSGFGDLKSAIRQVTDLPLYIINTHGHGDHTGGNAQFDEKIWIHSSDMDLCRQHCSYAMRKESVERAKHSKNYETGEVCNILPEDFDEEDYCTRGTGNLVPVKEGDIFALDGATLEIIFTPGHTQGEISVLYKEKNLMFTGDTTGSFVWLFDKDSTDIVTYIKTLEKMIELNAKEYIGAHSPRVMYLDDLLLYKHAAEEADYSKGEPFISFAGTETKPRVCAVGGYTLKDMFKPGFAAVVIGENDE